MRWHCPQDRVPLLTASSGSRCPQCGREYVSIEEIPVFASTHEVVSSTPRLDELWKLMSQGSSADAVRAFGERHGCSRTGYGTDWKFFFAARPGQRLLELGAGFGDDSLDLAGTPEDAVLIVPSATNARILERRLREDRPGRWSIAVVDELSALPLPDASVGVIVMEDAAAPGFGLSNATLPRAALEWRRVLAPGGIVFLGLGGRSRRAAALRRLQAGLGARNHPDSFNRVVKLAARKRSSGRLGLRATIRTMTGAGFPYPAIYAPLPDERKAHVVVPVEDARVVRYFLDHLVRKNSALVRTGLRLAHWSVTLNLFRFCVPYHYLVFKLERPAAAAQGVGGR